MGIWDAIVQCDNFFIYSVCFNRHLGMNAGKEFSSVALAVGMCAYNVMIFRSFDPLQ